MENLGVRIRRGRREIYRDQGVVQRFNITLAERLFGYQYAKELQNLHKYNRKWVKRLLEVIKAINEETKKPLQLLSNKKS